MLASGIELRQRDRRESSSRFHRTPRAFGIEQRWDERIANERGE